MSLANKTPADSYKDLVTLDNSNNGVKTDGNSTYLTDGLGINTSVKISDRNLEINSATDNTGALEVKNSSGTTKFVVDTTNNQVKALNQHVNTQYKDFGMFDLSPVAGTHYPMIGNNMMGSNAGLDFASTTILGTGTDPATSVDMSSHVSVSTNLVPAFWYLVDAITIDSIRVMGRADGSVNLNFHLFSYDLDTSSNYGDLSNGTLLAHINTSLACTTTTLKTDELVIDSADVSASKVILATVENETDTSDITTTMNIKYHTR